MEEANNISGSDRPKESKITLKVVFGTSRPGREGAIEVGVHDLNNCTTMLDVFQKHGYNEIDCARIYGGGSTEECIGQLNWQQRGHVMGTKLIPLQKGPFSYSHTKEGVKSGLLQSLKALQTDQVDLWSLHLPDHNTPYEETLEAVNELY
ncbi:hypothetical protein PISL3812_06096 [Talaromyces islandicus]|uniref:NADP-dependent oxidoreductase domain-containing protein n=1 Tax=Talaromyces islandicus TaxID=28573 RepID=A0A0U1M264_TALIS|nr:hypothetical protein PISL3812_06096 [Talaromyces islandicus]